jgi:fructose-1,6-bisphosphatase/inositol monophosphatase family enzyme
VLLVEEAGGRVSDYAGAPMPVDRGEILASNGLLHAAMRELLR